MKKVISFCLAALMSLTLFAGCSSGSKPASANTNSAKGKDATGDLNVWSWNYECGNFQGETDNDKITKKYQEYFKKFYPKINATFLFVASSDYYTKLKVALSAGSGPDVIALAPGSHMSESKPFLKPLATYAQRDWGKDWKNKFNDGVFDQIDSLGSQIYGMPDCTTYAGTVFYSQKILDKYNLKTPQTWDELESTAKTLRANGALPLVAGAKDNWTNEDMFMTLGAIINADKLYSAIDGKSKWTDADIVKAFSYFQKLFTDKIFQDGALGENMYNEAFSLWDDSDGNCKAAMQPNGSWAMNNFASNSNNYSTFSKWGRNVMLFPSIEGKEGKLLMTQDAVWCMTTDSKNPEAAWDFIKWSVSEEGQQTMVDSFAGYSVWKGISCKTSMSAELKTVYDKYAKWVKEGKIAGYRQVPYADLVTGLDTNLQKLATSEETPAQAAAAMETVSESVKR